MSSGCRWQEKSFSVPVGMKLIGSCCKCLMPCEVVFKYNGDSFCKECFGKLPSKIQHGNFGKFMTSKDKMWEFTDIHTTGKPVEIRSKEQWKKHIKKLGLNDDVKQSRKPEDIRQGYYEKSKFKPTDRREMSKQILETIKENRRIHVH
jgi:hypothetical protein